MVAQQHVQALGLRNEHRGPHQRLHAGRIVGEQAQQILGVKDADDVVAVTVVHGKTRVRSGDDMRQEFARCLADVDQLDLRARHHDVARRQFSHLEHALDHRQGIVIEQFAFVRSAQQAQQLFAVFRGAQQQRRKTFEQ